MKKQILFIGGGEDFINYLNKDFINKKFTFYKNDFDFNPFLEKQNNWKDNLKSELESDFDFIKMFRPDYTNYDLWKISFEKTISYLRDDFILIGHSLGAIFILKYFSENIHKINTVNKIFLISTPLSDTKDEVLGSFNLDKNLLENLYNFQKKIYFFHSRDDEIVFYNDFLEYKKIFQNSYFVDLDGYGHFIFNQYFPELLQKIKDI